MQEYILFYYTRHFCMLAIYLPNTSHFSVKRPIAPCPWNHPGNCSPPSVPTPRCWDGQSFHWGCWQFCWWLLETERIRKVKKKKKVKGKNSSDRWNSSDPSNWQTKICDCFQQVLINWIQTTIFPHVHCHVFQSSVRLFSSFFVTYGRQHIYWSNCWLKGSVKRNPIDNQDGNWTLMT